jgi:crotonobetainyl-CoA:carnitine CoA-transferase CaiB-like acyl-CoA transferase
LAALQLRSTQGIGNYIDVSIQEAVALCTEIGFPLHTMTGQEQGRHTGRHAVPTDLPKIQFACKDGRYVNCFTPRLDPEAFVRLRAWLAKHQLTEGLMDERLTDPEVLITSMVPVFNAVGRLASLFTAASFCAEAQRLGFPWTIVQAPSDLLNDAHLKARRFFTAVDHPEIGQRFTYPGAPYKMHGTPWHIHRRAPLLGKDNIAVYHGELGLSRARINALSKAGVI